MKFYTLSFYSIRNANPTSIQLNNNKFKPFNAHQNFFFSYTVVLLFLTRGIRGMIHLKYHHRCEYLYTSRRSNRPIYQFVTNTLK
jgi:hypothetical protein